MHEPARDEIEEQLLECWQRDLPLVPRPFAVIAGRLGVSEQEIIVRLDGLRASGVIARVGGVVRPNTLGASTLAAIAAPEFQTAEVAALLTEEPGVNHVYLRENDWNLWFVVTGPERGYVDHVLQRIARRAGRAVLDLRLERAYHIDLGFALSGRAIERHAPAAPDAGLPGFAPHPGDRALVQFLTDGLPLTSRPFRAVAAALDRGEDEIIERLRLLTATGIVPRLGVIVRHRALGWRSNAMVVWDVAYGDIDRAGAALAGVPAINLCYRRTRYPREWPFNLYCMVHARSRGEAVAEIEDASRTAALGDCPRQILFSLRCFKQTGAMLALPKEAA